MRGQRLRLGRARASPQATAQIKLPRNIQARATTLDVGISRLRGGIVSTAVVGGGGGPADTRKQPGTADRLAGPRSAQPLGSKLDVAVLAHRAAHQISQNRIVEGLPPRHLGLHLGGRGCGERGRQVQRWLGDGCGAPRQGQSDRHGKRRRQGAAGQAIGILAGRLPDMAGQRKKGVKSRHRIGLV